MLHKHGGSKLPVRGQDESGRRSVSLPLARLARVVQSVSADSGFQSGNSLMVEALPVVSGRATVEATARFVVARPLGRHRTLSRPGLSISPLGFGCHRFEDVDDQRAALEVAVKVGCNFIDVAPNYTKGDAERAVGTVLHELFAAEELCREEIVIATKVGNVVDPSLQLQAAHDGHLLTQVLDDVCHCLEPAWIEAELTRSLARLGLDCIDLLFLHCPEFALKAPGVSLDEVYCRITRAFAHLEREVERGRVSWYGVTAAFHPLRPADPEHLLLERILEVLPAQNHFAAIQFPLNFAEPHALWAGHTLRNGDGTALDRDQGVAALPLLKLAKQHGLATFINRPLDGIYPGVRGVLRFSSDVTMNSEMQAEDVDALEEKLTLLCSPGLGDTDEPVSGDLSSKTIKVLASLNDVDCVLVGMRRVTYVAGIVRLLKTTSSIAAADALNCVKRAHETLAMWFCTAGSEDDHGTAKEWRLPQRNA